jgi:hypothetical protein
VNDDVPKAMEPLLQPKPWRRAPFRVSWLQIVNAMPSERLFGLAPSCGPVNLSIRVRFAMLVIVTRIQTASRKAAVPWRSQAGRPAGDYSNLGRLCTTSC